MKRARLQNRLTKGLTGLMLGGLLAASAVASAMQCPSDIKGNECEYYKDGYKAGSEDGKASMSMAYERRAGDYDSRFEPYFARGYEAGWKANR